MEPERDFRENLKDAKKRRAAYDSLVKEGYDMEPYEEFERNIGFGVVAPAQQPQTGPQSAAGMTQVNAPSNAEAQQTGVSDTTPTPAPMQETPQAPKLQFSEGNVIKSKGKNYLFKGYDSNGNALVQQEGKTNTIAVQPETLSDAKLVSERAWQPTEQQKIQASYKINKMLSDFDKSSKARVEQTQRVADRMTPEGRARRKAGEMRARMAGVHVQPLGFLSEGQDSTPTQGGEDNRPNGGEKREGSTWGAQIIGVETVNGVLKPVYELPDGSTTTSYVEADKAEGSARKARLQHEFVKRMKGNGLDPSNQEDVQVQTYVDAIHSGIGMDEGKRAEVVNLMIEDGLDPKNQEHIKWVVTGDDRNILEHRLKVAEERLASLQAKRQEEMNKKAEEQPWYAGIGAPGVPGGVNPQDAQRMGRPKSELDQDIENATAEVVKINQSIREFDNYTEAAEGSWYGNLWRGVRDAFTNPNTWTMGVVDASVNKATRNADPSTEGGRRLLESAIMSDQLLQSAPDPGAVYRGAEFTGEMLADPSDWLLIGGSSAAGKVTKELGVKAMGKGMAKDVAERYVKNSLWKRIGLKGLEQGGFFGAFDFLGDVKQQLIDGGWTDEGYVDENGEWHEGEFQEGFSLPHALRRGGHGFAVGVPMGIFGAGTGNAGDWLTKAIDSGAGKVAVRAGEKTVGFVGEGTIFAMPEMLEFHTMSDAEFDAKYADKLGYGDETDPAKRAQARNAARNQMTYDAWTDSQANLFGIKASGKIMHAVQNPVATVKSVKQTIGDLKGADEREHRTFSERISQMMDKSPLDVNLTKDEREELQRNGYGDLADLFQKDSTKDQQRERANKKSSNEKGDMSTSISFQRAESETVHTRPEFDGYSDMEALMNDPNVSQATRAKAYFILTGHMLPMSTVVGYRESTSYDEEGKPTTFVEAVDVNGESITSRKFTNRKEAEREMNTIARQAELNNVEIGERYKEYEADNKVFEAALNEVARGADPATVKNIYDRVKSGDPNVSESQRQLADLLDEAIERNREVGDENRPSAIREKIKESTGIEIDEVLKKNRNERSDKETKALEQYFKELFPEQEKEVKTERGNDNPQLSSDRDIRFFDEETDGDEDNSNYPGGDGLRPEQQEAQRQYEAGREIIEEGSEPESIKADVDAIALRMKEAYQLIDDVFGAEAEIYHSQLESDPFTLANDPTLTPDQREAVLYFINSKAALEGVMDGANEASQNKMDIARQEINHRTNKDSGMVQPAVMKVDDRPVYIVKGNVVMYPDGSAVDSEKSSQTLVYVDPTDPNGEYKWASINEIYKADEPINPEEQLREVQNTIDAEHSAIFNGLNDVENAENDVTLQHGEGSAGQNNDTATEEQREGNVSGVAADSAGATPDTRSRGAIRVYEEGLANQRDAHPDDSERNRRRTESERLVETAKDNGQFMERREVHAKGEKVAKRTGESEVILNKEEGKVYKIKDPYSKSPMKPGVQPEDAIYEHLVHNKYFPESVYGFEGISEDIGDARIVLSQDYIESYGQPTKQEIDSALAEKGLYPEDNYYYGNDEVRVTDVTGDNAIIGADGKVYFIDPVIDFKKPVMEILEGDEPSIDGNPDNEPTPDGPTWQSTVDLFDGNKEEASTIVDAQIDQAEKAISVLQKKEPKYKHPKFSGSPLQMKEAMRKAQEEYRIAHEAWESEVNAQQRELDQWKAVKTEASNIALAEQAAQRAEQEERNRLAHEQAKTEFEEQQRIKAEKEAEQEALGSHAVNPRIKEKWDNANKIEGNADIVTLPDGSTIRGHYVLTEAGAATPSHDVNNAYAPTEGFPIDANGQSVNDRDYQKDSDAQRIVEDIAGAYDNRALQTPVIVSKDGIVLSGNNRTMSGELAAKQGTDRAYIDYLREFGNKYGFIPEVVEGFDNPRLVFVPDEDMPYDATTFSRFNAQEMKSQSKPEAAVKLGKIVPDNVFRNIVDDISRYDRLSDFYADEKAVAQTLGQLMQAGVINDKQMPELRTGTSISAAGKELVENTLIGKVFQTNPDAVRQIISTPTLRQGIVMGLSEIANNSTLAKHGYDLSDELAKAVDLVQRAKSSMPDIYTEGMPVSPFGRQAGLFDDEFGDSSVSDATTLLLADILNSGRPSDLRKVLAAYNSEASQSAAGQIDMFTGSVASKEEVLQPIIEHFRNATPKEQQALIDAAIAERKRQAENRSTEQSGGDEGSEQTKNAVQRSTEREKQPQYLREYKLKKTGKVVKVKPIIGKPDRDGVYKITFGADVFDEEGKFISESASQTIPIDPGDRFVVDGEEDFDWNQGGKFSAFEIRVSPEGVMSASAPDGATVFLKRNPIDGSEGVLPARYKEFVPEEKETVAKTEPQQPNNAVSNGSSLSEDLGGGIASPEPNGEPTVSDSKDNTLLSEEQAKSEKSSANGGVIAEEKSKDIFEEAESIAKRSKLKRDISRAEAEVNTQPTEAQKEAGNYRKGHVQIGTFDVTIENPKGSVRSGKDRDGKEWSVTMQHTYGYIRGTKGVDGDHIDVYASSDIDDWNGRKVFVVDQYNPDGTFDEHKVMLGFNDKEEAYEAYLSNYEKGWENGRRIDISTTNIEDFEKWIDSSKRKTKPFGEYKTIKKDEDKPLLTEKEADSLIETMKAGAVTVKEVEINDSSWKPVVTTPIGEVKMGENQKEKLFEKGRGDQYGMVLDTLENPDIILEEKDKDENLFHERPSSYLFIKTFQKADGSKYIHFENVTVSQDGMEVSISSHIIREKQLRNKMKSDRLLYKATALDEPANSSAEQPIEGGSLSSVLGESTDKTTDTDDNPNKDLRGDTALSQNSDVSESKGSETSEERQIEERKISASITPTTYTNKKGKTSDISLVKFSRELTAEEKAAAKRLISEPLSVGKKTPKGWYDREESGYMMRSEEAAKELVNLIDNPEGADVSEKIADNQPLSKDDYNEAVKKVDVEGVFQDLNTKGETRLSEHSKPTKRPTNQKTIEEVLNGPEPKATIVEDMVEVPTPVDIQTPNEKPASSKTLKITEDMKRDEDILRDLLGIGEDEVGDMRFKDLDELTPQQKRQIYAAGVNYSIGYIEQGIVSFDEFARAMSNRLGDKIKPWLKSFYEGVKRIPGYEEVEFTPSEDVDRFDVENMDKPQPDIFKGAETRAEESKVEKVGRQAEKELIDERNEQRKQEDEQTRTNTEALETEAKSIGKEADTLVAAARSNQAGEGEINNGINKIDDTLNKINEQLALLGYYESGDPIAEIEKRVATDGVRLAQQLALDLGINFEDMPKGRDVIHTNFREKRGILDISLPVKKGYEPLMIEVNFKNDGRGYKVSEVSTRLKRGDAYSYVIGYDNRTWLSHPTYQEVVESIRESIEKYLPKAEAPEEIQTPSNKGPERETKRGTGAQTPILKQYEEMKKKHPDAILLFRVGDFYEVFKQDAVDASKILGITLTRRANGKEGAVELAGFPHQALDTYLPKLVRSGRRVAMCEQLEDPKLTKKLVKRPTEDKPQPREVADQAYPDKNDKEAVSEWLFENADKIWQPLDGFVADVLSDPAKVPTFNDDINSRQMQKDVLSEYLDEWIAKKATEGNDIEENFAKYDATIRALDNYGQKPNMVDVLLERIHDRLKPASPIKPKAERITLMEDAASNLGLKDQDIFAEAEKIAKEDKEKREATRQALEALDKFDKKRQKKRIKPQETIGSLFDFAEDETPEENAPFAPESSKEPLPLKIPEERPTQDLSGDSADFQKKEKQTKALVAEIGLAISERLAEYEKNPETKPLTMREIKKLAEEYPELKGISDTDLQELVELAMTQLTRNIAMKGMQWGNPLEERRAYDKIVGYYQMQPSLNARDSERLIKQQYSTPTPFGFVMGQFVQARGKSINSGLEPSAGNGALTITLNPRIMHVNDIDQARLANLRKLGFGEVTAQNALLPFDGDMVDVVLTNPPFGTVTERVYDGIFKISSLEGQMAINALDKMKDNGRAAIVIGGNTSYRTNGSMNPKDAAFFGYLYSHYNVADVINISGKALYSRNGTGYDVRMILIDGRKTGPFQRVYPPVQSKARAEQVTTFDELYNRVQNDISNLQQVGDRPSGADERPIEATEGTGGTRVRSGSDNPNAGTGERPDTTSEGVGSTPKPSGTTSLRGNEQQGADRLDNGNGGNATSINNVFEGNPEQSKGRGNNGGRNERGAGGNDGRETVAEQPASGGGRLDVASGERQTPRTQGLKTKKEEVKADLTTEKVPYPNQSNNGFTLLSVVPAAQAEPLQRSLGEIGDVDQFLVDNLGYSSKEELYGYLAAEQIDSVALAINQMGKGNAFIIGDMTGVGKGRQGAALIRYAVKKGKTPIYFTQKPTLFTDNYRDLSDIGSSDLRPFIIASNPKDANIVDVNGKVVHKLPSEKERERVFNHIMKTGNLPEEYDYVLTTYDQIKNGTKDYEPTEGGWNKVDRSLPKKSKGYTTADHNGQKRRDALARLAEGNITILDESHTVGGDSGMGRFMQMLTKNSRGVTFLSATFAKRADNMPIYAQRTAMSEAGVTQQELIEAINKGGVTLQEIMSKQLVESGQMIRRERSFEGVTIDWLNVEEETDQRQRAQFNEVARIFNDIRNFQDEYITPWIEERNKDAAEFGATVGHTQGTKDMGVKNVPFASKMYNLVNQLLFALKVDAVADRVIWNLKNGYKPVISFTNTMEGFLSEAPKGVEMDEIPDFSLTLMRALDGVMRYTTKDADDNSEGSTINFSELPPEAQSAYNEIRRRIANLSAELPISPMDAIRMKIEDAGYRVAEITGRTVQLDKTANGKYVVSTRKDRDKKANMRDFNSGKLDVLMINKSGSTGISLHASSKFEDQRQRVMVFAQFQSDINDEVQMRGRIDRSGQVTRGRYEYIMSTIPAEQRIQMMFKAKLKSLDANTTSSQKSKFNEMEIVDYLNKYGDEVVWDYMTEHPELEERLGDPLDMLSGKRDEDDKPNPMFAKSEGEKKSGAAGKISRYLAFLPVEEQDAIFKEITEAYKVKMQLLDDAGENDLEITTMPLNAETINKKIWQEGSDPNGSNAFADNTYVEEVEVDVLKKPMKRAEIEGQIRRNMGDDVVTANDYDQERYGMKGGEINWKRYADKKTEEIKSYYRNRADETVARMQESAEKKVAKEKERATNLMLKERGKGNNDYSDSQIAALAEDAGKNIAQVEQLKQNEARRKTMAIADKFEKLLNRFSAGQVFVVPQNLKMGDDGLFTQTYGIFTGFKFNKTYTLGSSTATFATLDGRRKVELALSDPAIETILRATSSAYQYFPKDIRALSLANWDEKVPNKTRQKRYIITGNLLQALVDTNKGGATKGNLISYTTQGGDVKQGILMSENFKPSDLRNSAPISSKLAQIQKGDKITSENGDVSIERVSYGWEHRGQYELRVPKSKQRGGQYSMDTRLLNYADGGNFISKGNNMVAYFRAEELPKVLDILSRPPFNVTVLEASKLSDSSTPIDDNGIRYRIREEEAPKKTGIGYKVFVLKDGMLYPPMVANPGGEATPVGVWLDADAAPVAGLSKTGRQQVKAGGKGTQGGSGTLAYRPGWHLGKIPYALQFNRKGESGAKELFPKNFVWAEVEYANDHDYQEEAMSYGINKNGKFQHSLAGLPRLPKDGAYEYRTNPNPETDPWIITGAMKVNRLLTPSEVDEMVRAAGREPQKRQEGGVTDREIEELNKTYFPKRNREGEGPQSDYEINMASDLIARVLGHSNKTPRQQRAWADRERKYMNKIATTLGKNLGLNIDIRQDNSGLKGRRARAKGWYDVNDGKITVIIGNHTSAADVEKTILHEAVAHHGLRQLLGEHFDEFIDKVYNHSEDWIREKIDGLTDKMIEREAERLTQKEIDELDEIPTGFIRDAYKEKNRAKAEAKRDEYRKEATEEFMADVAEETDFENADTELHGWLHKVKKWFIDVLFKLGFKHIKGKILGLNELKYILWRSYQNLRHPGWYRGFEWEAEDIAMRHKTGVLKEQYPEEGSMNIESVAEGAEREMIEAENARFNMALGKYGEEGLRPGEYISAGRPLGVMKNFMPDLEIMLRQRVLGKAKKKHGLEVNDLRNLPGALSYPIFVFQRSDESIGVLTELKNKNGKNLFVAIDLGLKKQMNSDFLEVNDIVSIHGREIENIILPIVDNGTLRYADKEKGLNWLSSAKSKSQANANQSPLSETEKLSSAELNPQAITPAVLEAATKVIENFENPKFGADEINKEEGLLFRDGESLTETIERMSTEAEQANVDNLETKREAMRALGGNLNKLRSAMARQREYDTSTVKSITGLVKTLMDRGLLDDMSKYETKRILSASGNVVGRQDISKYVDKVMDILVDNQLRAGAKTFGQMLTIKGSKVDARGVEVQGVLDPDGQRIAQVVKKTTSLPKKDIEDKIAEALNRMGSSDITISEEAALEYAGLQISRQYAEEITESKAEEKSLRDSIKQAKEDKDAGHMTETAYKQYVEATEDAIRQNKAERAEAYQSLIEQMSGVLGESIERAKAWKKAEVARVKEIQHNANSDMEGRPNNEHHKDSRLQKFSNNSWIRFFLSPLATFDQMLRMFGKKNARGEGYLWNRYMRGWVDATEKEYTGYRSALKVLDDKVSEVFGKKMSWGDLFTIDRKLPKGSVTFWDGGEMREHELTQGNMLYIYMADKMSDGRMKLRRMGITEEDIEDIKDFLDPRFIELADWMQDEFLTEKRNEYNEVHKRMFGASMAAIENYFPLKILANARIEEVDVADDTTDTALPATSTGSIIKRRRNNLALDVTGANAFSVILDHLQQMERWAAFAEYNRDLNTLLSYKRFRNQVMNMNSAYGAGKTLWNNFRNVAAMSAGAYRPPIASLDKAAVNIAKGVTAAKVSFRVFTALKQFLSFPAYMSDVNPMYLAKSIANPVKAWSWCMENLPIFEKRWKSRMAGDPRLMKTEMDWKAWRSNIVQMASRIGMSPNAFVDALTVAIGTYPMYETKLKKYMRQGYAKDVAEKRAKQDATILFNQTQQSSEGAFLSTMQVDRSWFSVLFTVFRNSSMSYTRQLYDAIRNLKGRGIDLLNPEEREKSIEFMAKQILRNQKPEEEEAWSDNDWAEAKKSAKSEYRNTVLRDLVKVGIFGFGLQLLWNLGPYLPYLFLGKDEDEKGKMWDDVWNHTMFGSIEGLTGGDVMSAAGQMWKNGEGNPAYLVKDMPLASDISTILKKWSKDKASAMNDIINLLIQSGVGVNPQSLTDAVVAIMDACGDDANSQRECALLITRIINCPPSQIDKIYFDEIDATGTEASEMTPAEIAERYAEYKMMREAPLTGWLRDEATTDSIRASREKRVLDRAKENIKGRVATEETKRLVSEYDSYNKRRKAAVEGLEGKERQKALREFDKKEGRAGKRAHKRVGEYKRDIKDLTEAWLKTKDLGRLQELTDSMMRVRERMLEEIEAIAQ